MSSRGDEESACQEAIKGTMKNLCMYVSLYIHAWSFRQREASKLHLYVGPGILEVIRSVLQVEPSGGAEKCEGRKDWVERHKKSILER